MLKAKVVLPDGTRVNNDEGTPQGGPLSPLLSNVVLDELDWELDRRGLRFVRCADDFSIFVRSERSGHRVMGSSRPTEGRQADPGTNTPEPWRHLLRVFEEGSDVYPWLVRLLSDCNDGHCIQGLGLPHS
jgi:hypothetical protein